jgi:hypothetical protein
MLTPDIPVLSQEVLNTAYVCSKVLMSDSMMGLLHRLGLTPNTQEMLSQ